MSQPEQHSKTEVFPPWHFERWRAVDDRVRGGSSVSHLDPVDATHHSTGAGNVTSEKSGSSLAARFWGHLDISTLGGAGFASQTFLFAPTPLHLSRTIFDGIRLDVSADPQASESSPEIFTLVLKNTIRTKPPKEPKLPPQPEPAVLTYEASFQRPHGDHEREERSGVDVCASGSKVSKVKEIEIGWSEFKPHYRGREIPRDDERWKPLDTEGIYEISFMCRSGFGKQEGDFGIIIEKLSGLEKKSNGLMRMGGGRGDWGAWLRSWWTWLSTWFVGGARIRLDEKV